jgi:hypothetical protein
LHWRVQAAAATAKSLSSRISSSAKQRSNVADHCIGEDYAAGRFNEGQKDLNRDFPTWRQLDSNSSDLEAGRQPETIVGTSYTPVNTRNKMYCGIGAW